jgi:ketosteroid isomerase-like protein
MGGAGALAPGVAGAAAVDRSVVDELVRRSEAANDALMRGDLERYRALVRTTEDFTLMSPFGGEPTRGMTEARWSALGRFFRNGRLKQDLVQAYASPDMVVLAVIERAVVEVGALPSQDWALRVTLVYRRDPDGWALAHRHADPLAPGVSLQQAAALARGQPEQADRPPG